MSDDVMSAVKSAPTNDDFDKAKRFFNDEEYSKEEFFTLARLYSDSFRDVKEGEMIKGKVVRVQNDFVIVDVGFKSEGAIPKDEFGSAEVKVGQEIEVVLESVEDQD